MEMALGSVDWQQLLHAVEDSLLRIAHRNGVQPDLLRQQYVLSSLIVTTPFPEYPYSAARQHQQLGQSVAPPFYMRAGGIGALPKYKSKQRIVHTANDEDVSFNYRPTAAAPSDDFSSQPRLIENPENANTKIYCDIEAALRGEMSDASEEYEATSVAADSAELLNERPVEDTARRPDTEVIELASRYQTQPSLEANVLHKCYICHIEDKVMYVRLLNKKNHVVPEVSVTNLATPATNSLQMGTPVLCRTQFKKNGKEPKWCRGCIDGVDIETGLVCVRLVDHGIPLKNISVDDLRVLALSQNSPPATYRIDCSQIDEISSFTRHSFAGIRLVPVFSGQPFSGWNRSWRATFIQPHPFSSQAVPSGELLTDSNPGVDENQSCTPPIPHMDFSKTGGNHHKENNNEVNANARDKEAKAKEHVNVNNNGNNNNNINNVNKDHQNNNNNNQMNIGGSHNANQEPQRSQLPSLVSDNFSPRTTTGEHHRQYGMNATHGMGGHALQHGYGLVSQGHMHSGGCDNDQAPQQMNVTHNGVRRKKNQGRRH